MRLQSLTVLMFAVVFGAGAVGCAAQTGEPSVEASASSELRAGNSVTHSAFEKALKDEETQWLDSADGCTFSVKAKGSDGLELSLTADGGTVTLDVSEQAKITLKEKDSDGTEQTFTIAGVGSVHIIHADDAFESFALTSSATNKTSTCEIDF
jgi:hypothetical protein